MSTANTCSCSASPPLSPTQLTPQRLSPSPPYSLQVSPSHSPSPLPCPCPSRPGIHIYTKLITIVQARNLVLSTVGKGKTHKKKPRAKSPSSPDSGPSQGPGRLSRRPTTTVTHGLGLPKETHATPCRPRVTDDAGSSIFTGQACAHGRVDTAHSVPLLGMPLRLDAALWFPPTDSTMNIDANRPLLAVLEDNFSGFASVLHGGMPPYGRVLSNSAL